MPNIHGLSRRTILEMGAAAGGVALTAGLARAAAPPAPHIEQLAPELDKITDPHRAKTATVAALRGKAEHAVGWVGMAFADFAAAIDDDPTTADGEVVLVHDATVGRPLRRRKVPASTAAEPAESTGRS